ncbi:MAG TPA: DUF1810 domain-containing protein, partial [Candidatus Limnocylindrales bacterium]
MADLDRFVRAQQRAYHLALHEIRGGRKTSHWMWFVFPQLAGLGRSEMARAYSIADLAEAQAYLGHPILGPRLREISRVTLELPAEVTGESVFGEIDALKLRSSMTLFALAAPDEVVFRDVL